MLHGAPLDKGTVFVGERQRSDDRFLRAKIDQSEQIHSWVFQVNFSATYGRHSSEPTFRTTPKAAIVIVI
jgi:hypothetical protein